MFGRPAHRWGFHQLRDDWARRVVEAAELRAGELVVDLGAGRGALTLPLLDLGVRVIAVELHAGRADQLRRRVAGRACSVLTLDLTEFRFPGRPVRAVANPPFALAAELLAALVRSPHVVSADVVLPRWLTARHVADLRHRRGFAASEGLRLPPTAFVPTAPLPCSVLRLHRIRAARGSGHRSRRRGT